MQRALGAARLLGARPARFRWPVRLQEERVSARGLGEGVQVVALRGLRRRDEGEWLRLRRAEQARLSPWEATDPPGGGEAPPGFASYVRQQDRRARGGEAMPLVVEVDGALAGQVSADPIRWGAVRSAQVGYWVGAAYEGRGVMRLALAMALDHLLGPTVGLHRVEIHVRPQNQRSMRLCRSLGLRQEGLHRGYMHIDGAWADHVSFAVLAEECGEAGGMVGKLLRQAADRSWCDKWDSC